MICPKYKENLTAWLDNELDADGREELDRHLELCPSCREELNRQQSDRTWWESLPRTFDPSPQLWPNILAELHKDSVAGRKKWLVAIQDFFLPDFSFSWSRALMTAGLAGILFLSSSLLLFPPLYSPSDDPSTLSAMEDYWHWRTREAGALRRPLSEGLSIGELKANNPFLDSKPSAPRTNPFISG